MREEDGVMPTEEDLALPQRREESYSQAVEWADDLLDIIEAIEDGDYTEALAQVMASELPKETRSRLEKALVTNDEVTIKILLDDYRGRLGQVFCEACWS